MNEKLTGFSSSATVEFVEGYPLQCNYEVATRKADKQWKVVFDTSLSLTIPNLAAEDTLRVYRDCGFSTNPNSTTLYFDREWRALVVVELFHTLSQRLDWPDFLFSWRESGQGSTWGDKKHLLLYSARGLSRLKASDAKPYSKGVEALMAIYQGHLSSKISELKSDSPLLQQWKIPSQGKWVQITREYEWDSRFDSWKPFPVKLNQ